MQQVLLDRLVQLELLVSRGPLVALVYQGPLEHKVAQVQQEVEAFLVLKAYLEVRVQLVQRETPVLSDLLELQAYQVALELLV